MTVGGMANLSMTLSGWEAIVVSPVMKTLRDRQLPLVAEVGLTVSHRVEVVLAVSRHG